MSSGAQTAPGSKKKIWAGRIISALVVLFLLFDGIAKLMKVTPVLQACARLGYRESLVVPIGILLLACTAVYVIPRTSVFGAILLTAYLGGATATHVRAGEPFYFPVRSEEHTSELQSRENLVCRLLLEKKKKNI